MAYSAHKTITSIVTGEELKEAFSRLGVTSGMVVEVHSSLSALDYVVGGAQTLNDVLIDLISYEGTIVMPLQDVDNTDPSGWKSPRAEHSLHQMIRDALPAYHRKESDSRKMGAVADNFRRREGVVTSFSPSSAYGAWGKYARIICERQPLHFPLGEASPTSHLYDLDGYVLLIGVGYESATVLHLAEYRTMARGIIIRAGAVEMQGKRVYKKYLDLDIDSECFAEYADEMEQKIPVSVVKIHDCECRLFKVRDAVDFLCMKLKGKRYEE